MEAKIRPFLWFDDQASQAAEYYCSIFKNSKITDQQAGPDGKIMMVSFVLDGQPLMALNGGPEFKFNEAISLFVSCDDQAEIDHYWSKLTAGGVEQQCGWLKDRFGLSWQIVPKVLGELMADPDRARAKRVMEAMLKMVKLDIEGLQKAYDGK